MEQPKSLSIVFEKNKNCITFPTSGAYGGPAADGVVVHFYIEYHSVPHSLTIPVAGEKIDFSHEERISRGDITREIQASTYLSPETAISIGDWLIQNGKKALDLKKGGSGND